MPPNTAHSAKTNTMQFQLAHVTFKNMSEEATEQGNFGYFEGYASTFGNTDRMGDVIQAGAFAETIKACNDENRYIKLCWQHDFYTPIGTVRYMQEDQTGLLVKGRINLDTTMGKEAYALLKAGDLDSMSIGFSIKEGRTEEKTGTYYIEKAELWEVSIVTEPANAMAKITEVKQAIRDADSMKDIEELLRDKGFSRKEATAITSRMKQIARRDAAASTGDGENPAESAEHPEETPDLVLSSLMECLNGIKSAYQTRETKPSTN